MKLFQFDSLTSKKANFIGMIQAPPLSLSHNTSSSPYIAWSNQEFSSVCSLLINIDDAIQGKKIMKHQEIGIKQTSSVEDVKTYDDDIFLTSMHVSPEHD